MVIVIARLLIVLSAITNSIVCILSWLVPLLPRRQLLVQAPKTRPILTRMIVIAAAILRRAISAIDPEASALNLVTTRDA